MAPPYESDFHAQGFLPGNDFALPYVSAHTRMHDSARGLLDFANCSYLSTAGRAPTLEVLKKHAQSLCILISQLSITTRFTPITRENGVIPEFDENDAFDWLQDLSKPYSNSNRTHQEPLNSLVNEAKGHHELLGTDYHCPLVEMKPHFRKKGQAQMPYASHHNLVRHVNSCLEFLDHEYGATGGLLSILPTDQDHDTEELKAAKNTLLGQWLRYTQHLVGRMHELEIAYGNALDALSGEAAIPALVNGCLGPDGVGGSGRTIVHGQDKWILANAGDDVLSYVHKLMDKAEAQIEQKEAIWRNSGVMGSRMWMEERGGEAYAKGIVPIDITTRYYRLRGQAGKGGPIFVLPAWEHHPAVSHTRELENRPTVVSVVTPQWPERVSEFVARNQDRLMEATESKTELQNAARLLAASQSDVALLQQEIERERARNKYTEAKIGELTSHQISAPGGDGAPQNPLPLKLDNDNLRAGITALQKREAIYRAEIEKLQGRIGDLEAAIKLGTLTMADDERRECREMHRKVQTQWERLDMEDRVRNQQERDATGIDTPLPEGAATIAERQQARGAAKKRLSEISRGKQVAVEDVNMSET